MSSAGAGEDCDCSFVIHKYVTTISQRATIIPCLPLASPLPLSKILQEYHWRQSIKSSKCTFSWSAGKHTNNVMGRKQVNLRGKTNYGILTSLENQQFSITKQFQWGVYYERAHLRSRFSIDGSTAAPRFRSSERPEGRHPIRHVLDAPQWLYLLTCTQNHPPHKCQRHERWLVSPQSQINFFEGVVDIKDNLKRECDESRGHGQGQWRHRLQTFKLSEWSEAISEEGEKHHFTCSMLAPDILVNLKSEKNQEDELECRTAISTCCWRAKHSLDLKLRLNLHWSTFKKIHSLIWLMIKTFSGRFEEAANKLRMAYWVDRPFKIVIILTLQHIFKLNRM